MNAIYAAVGRLTNSFNDTVFKLLVSDQQWRRVPLPMLMPSHSDNTLYSKRPITIPHINK